MKAMVSGDIAEYGAGAFSEYVAVPEQAIVLKPASLTMV